MVGEATVHYAHARFKELKAISVLTKVIMLNLCLPNTYHTLGLVYDTIGNAEKAAVTLVVSPVAATTATSCDDLSLLAATSCDDRSLSPCCDDRSPPSLDGFCLHRHTHTHTSREEPDHFGGVLIDLGFGLRRKKEEDIDFNLRVDDDGDGEDDG
ncbi:hypothetical protein Q3G72_016403 [Acer saccharum]|nr:hypothetical protein Q3G72_016403 [Acer saccharum]